MLEYKTETEKDHHENQYEYDFFKKILHKGQTYCDIFVSIPFLKLVEFLFQNYFHLITHPIIILNLVKRVIFKF